MVVGAVVVDAVETVSVVVLVVVVVVVVVGGVGGVVGGHGIGCFTILHLELQCRLKH